MTTTPQAQPVPQTERDAAEAAARARIAAPFLSAEAIITEGAYQHHCPPLFMLRILAALRAAEADAAELRARAERAEAERDAQAERAARLAEVLGRAITTELTPEQLKWAKQAAKRLNDEAKGGLR